MMEANDIHLFRGGFDCFLRNLIIGYFIELRIIVVTDMVSSIASVMRCIEDIR